MLTLTSPVETPLHHWPAGAKLLLVAAGTMMIFALPDWRWGLGALALIAAGYLALGQDFARTGLRHLRPLWPFLLVLAVWHLWLQEPGRGVLLASRMFAAVALANLVTMTTRLDAMMAVIQRLLTPLARFGLRPEVVALSIALVIRFVPVLLDKAAQLRQSWRARSPKTPAASIILPLAVLALDDADHVAEALRARGGL